MSEQNASPGPQPQELVIDDVETLRAMADPMRMRIHAALDYPRTAKQLAELLDVPQTRLYYHVKILERAGLIRVVSRRVVSGIEERTYQTSAKSTTISPTIAGLLVETGAVKSMLDMVAAELELAMRDGGPPLGQPGSSVIALTYTGVKLRPDQVEEFQDRLFELLSEYNAPTDDPEKVDFQLFIEGHRRRDAS